MKIIKKKTRVHPGPHLLRRRGVRPRRIRCSRRRRPEPPQHLPQHLQPPHTPSITRQRPPKSQIETQPHQTPGNPRDGGRASERGKKKPRRSSALTGPDPSCLLAAPSILPPGRDRRWSSARRGALDSPPDLGGKRERRGGGGDAASRMGEREREGEREEID